MSEIFERATKKKLRFDSGIGMLTVEDLWDLPLVSTTSCVVSLDIMARKINSVLKASEEESFVEPTTKKNATAVLQMDIVKRIIEVRLADRDRAEKAQATRAKKQQILEILASKENEALAGKSEDELKALLDSM